MPYQMIWHLYEQPSIFNSWSISAIMDAETYKRLIAESNVLDHTTLNITLKEVVSKQAFELAAVLQNILKNNKIEKPALPASQHDASPNYYKIDLSDDVIDQIIDIFFDLEAEYTNDDGDTTPTSSFYATLVDKWSSVSKRY